MNYQSFYIGSLNLQEYFFLLKATLIPQITTVLLDYLGKRSTPLDSTLDFMLHRGLPLTNSKSTLDPCPPQYKFSMVFLPLAWDPLQPGALVAYHLGPFPSGEFCGLVGPLIRTRLSWMLQTESKISGRPRPSVQMCPWLSSSRLRTEREVEELEQQVQRWCRRQKIHHYGLNYIFFLSYISNWKCFNVDYQYLYNNKNHKII